ncbi:hypothetical protein ES703_109191 [subsurface metagenome]
MSFLNRSAKHFLAIKAAREIREKIEQAGFDNLKALADAGKSIIGIYLKGCSPEEKKKIRQDGNALAKLGVTPEMVLEELAGQNEEFAVIMDEGRKDYKKNELKNLEAFLKEE